MDEVKAKVEDTLPSEMPDQITILRLDTDWYQSTYHELQHLFPKPSKDGLLVLDDYGYWKGATEAGDQYIEKLQSRTEDLIARFQRSPI